MNRILVFHTAFPGDIVLTLPLLQRIRSAFPRAQVGMVTIPLAAEVLLHHPAVDERIIYDKRAGQRGLRAMVALGGRLRRSCYDVAIVPHRSLRSALICRLARIPRRIGFSTSAGSALFTDRVPDDRTAHEIMRNLALLGPLGVATGGMELPALYPDGADRAAVDGFLALHPALLSRRLVAVAPGSVWNTKRWPAGRFARLVRLLLDRSIAVVLVGGVADRPLCDEIQTAAKGEGLASAAGAFSLLQSAELLRRCAVCVTNDSAPMHLAGAVRTPVVALFGATVPEFGFGPTGAADIVVQTDGLSCRPCSIHGGRVCPIGTFDCMERITAEEVFRHVVGAIS